jgi:hypothetical protein
MLVMLLGLGTVWIWAMLPHSRGTGYLILRLEVELRCVYVSYWSSRTMEVRCWCLVWANRQNG